MTVHILPLVCPTSIHDQIGAWVDGAGRFEIRVHSLSNQRLDQEAIVDCPSHPKAMRLLLRLIALRSGLDLPPSRSSLALIGQALRADNLLT